MRVDEQDEYRPRVGGSAMRQIAIFGATGQTGRFICELLLGLEDIEVVACARTPEKLAKLQKSLEGSGARLSTRAVDLRSAADVDDIVRQVDLVVGATSQWQDGVALAARAAEQSTDYCGIYLSNPEKWERLRALEDVCVAHGAMAIDDCGTHPGLPGAMIRWFNQRAPLRAAWVGGKFDLEWDKLGLAYETVTEFIAEIETAEPSIFCSGEWKRGYSLTRDFDFGGDGRTDTCTPMLMEEIREVVETESLDSAGFYIAGFGRFIDYVVIPTSMALSKVSRKMSRDLLWWGLRRHASRPSFAVVQLDGERADGSGPVLMKVAHADPYYLTAVPVVATIQQALEDPKPGVWTQSSFVDPDLFFTRLREMGVQITTEPEERT